MHHFGYDHDVDSYAADHAIAAHNHRMISSVTHAMLNIFGDYGGHRRTSAQEAFIPPQRQEFQFDESTSLSSLSAHEISVLTQQLKEEEANKRPLISAALDISILRAEYEHGNQAIREKIGWLQSQGWHGMRRTRGDGDCFYRSLAYAYVERLVHAQDIGLAVATARSILERTLPLLQLAGFEKMVSTTHPQYEDFYETFTELIDSVAKPNEHNKTLDEEALLTFFQTPELSNSVVVFLRLVTSAQIRADPDSFEPFLFNPETFDPLDIRTFCESQVEATGKEADHPQITALTRALSINVHVAYLDGSAGNGGAVDFVKFEPVEDAEDDGAKPVTLLFRPGHYDILEYNADGTTTTPPKRA
ncbi:hypothetical protein FRB96_005546 [Tulasnella sp. 330]|nr:hypothetical protein FRB96_005546 [Tulasnella sp. 330]KAG8879394.1 hypothetical protein FRB97_001665 [Tulasnella sp. 331]KAG8887883.1 hypothetical protein FRB98_008778 [Tulasnella sp. 332]